MKNSESTAKDSATAVNLTTGLQFTKPNPERRFDADVERSGSLAGFGTILHASRYSSLLLGGPRKLINELINRRG